MDENVVEMLLVSAFALFSLLMNEDFNWLAVELNVSALFDSFFSNFGTFKLDITKTAAFSIRVLFQFA